MSVCLFVPSDTKDKSRRAKVTYSYVAENPDELSLQPGQVCVHTSLVPRLCDVRLSSRMIAFVLSSYFTVQCVCIQYAHGCVCVYM